MSAAGSLVGRLRRSHPEPDDFDERPIPGYVRVNLLPAQVAMREKVRRAKRAAAVMLGVAVALDGGLWVLAQMEAGKAKDELSAAQAEGAQTNAQMAQYSQVPTVFAAAELAQASLNAAMGNEVKWAFLLNQLSFSTPPGVTLQTIDGTVGGSQTGQGGQGAQQGEGSANPALPTVSSIGAMTFNGTADSYESVASWLDSLEKIKDYTYPFLTNATADDQGGVTFDSTAQLTDKALSGRYGPPPASTPAPSPAPGPSPAPTPGGP